MTDTIIETDRLILRDWRDTDREPAYAHINSNPDVMRWLDGVQTRAECDAMIDKLTGRQEQCGHTFWALERKDDGALLGFCGLLITEREIVPTCGEPEVGWRLRKDIWGRGYAKEAAAASLSFGFDTLGFERIHALTIPENTPSWGLMGRLGMTYRPELDYIGTDWGPQSMREIIYTITAEEWRERRKEFEA
ncbi:GNAT family N-acetyltransferase [Parasphingopyxis sp.]|uniref:GNAT family N-acetyltransferase n=1 Tax=Parasphingopyxis sp. TaxID=1920299 RepID=UPI002636CA66|nr:GNAT family N-acetyltransferase [Parasphingopyxis sp.]